MALFHFTLSSDEQNRAHVSIFNNIFNNIEYLHELVEYKNTRFELYMWQNCEFSEKWWY